MPFIEEIASEHCSALQCFQFSSLSKVKTNLLREVLTSDGSTDVKRCKRCKSSNFFWG